MHLPGYSGKQAVTDYCIPFAASGGVIPGHSSVFFWFNRLLPRLFYRREGRERVQRTNKPENLIKLHNFSSESTLCRAACNFLSGGPTSLLRIALIAEGDGGLTL